MSKLKMTDTEARCFASAFIDAAPEHAASVEEYDWSVCTLSHLDLIDTGLHRHFAEHARNISLDPGTSDLTRPVVVSLGDGELDRLAVWDGVHRIMSALYLAAESIPAIVGRRRAFRWGVTRYLDLPVDMQVLLVQFIGDLKHLDSSRFDVASSLVPVKYVPIAPFLAQVKAEQVADGADWWDYRGPEHVLGFVESFLSGAEVPPIVVDKGRWIDGRHRILASELAGKSELPVIDLAHWIRHLKKNVPEDGAISPSSR